MPTQLYDIIGDVHGHADALEALLHKLGYARQPAPSGAEGRAAGHYAHPEGRKVIFLGDLLDRGTQNKRVLEIARAMQEAQSALVIMGNHELNAIGYATPSASPEGEYLRRHTDENEKQHAETLAEYQDPHEYRELVSWLKTLPAWIDLGDLRVIHACWRRGAMERLVALGLVEERPLEGAAGAVAGFIRFDDPRFELLYTKGEEAFRLIEVLLKGVERTLPNGLSFRDKSCKDRSETRVRWWLTTPPKTWGEAALEPSPDFAHLPFAPEDDYERYTDETPVFVGHYWLRLDGPDAHEGQPRPLTPSVYCLDWSVTRGALVAFRLTRRGAPGEQALGEFVCARGVLVWS